MFEEGSKPRPDPQGPAEAGPAGESRARSLGSAPWWAIVGAWLGTGGLGALILAASWPGGPPQLWPDLARNFWLVAAISVLICFGFGMRNQIFAWIDLRRLRFSGAILVASGAIASVLAGVLIGFNHADPLPVQVGLVAFFLGDGIAASGLLGRQLMTGSVPDAPPAAAVRSVAMTIVEPGALIPFDGVVVSGRSEVDEAPIGGSPLGALRGAGDIVRRGARNGDGRLSIEPAVEASFPTSDSVAAPVFPRGFDSRAGWILAAGLAAAASASVFFAPVAIPKLAVGPLVFAIATPVALGLVRPLVYARARGMAASQGWHLNGTAALAALADVTALVCGRGGVISRAGLEIVALHPAVDIEPGELVAAAASLAQSSQGVWARALLNYAVARKLRLAPLAEWSDEIHESGIGLRARTQGGQLLIAGPREWVADQGIRTHFLESKEHESLAPGRKSLWIAQLSPLPILIGVIVAGERLKPGALEMCKNAKRFGLTGALLDRRDVEGGAEFARYLGLRLVEDDAMARKAMATEWATLGLRAAIAQHRGDPEPDAPIGPRLLLGARMASGGRFDFGGGWAAATDREDPRLVMDLLRLARATRRREQLGYLLAYVFCVPGLWSTATGHFSAAILTLAAAVGTLGVVSNAQLLALLPRTADDIDEE